MRYSKPISQRLVAEVHVSSHQALRHLCCQWVQGSRRICNDKKQLASIGGVHWKDVRDTMQAALDGGDKVSFMDQVSMLAQFCFSWQSN